jgi:protocatechuate 3,4-dioxygenase beta subunit
MVVPLVDLLGCSGSDETGAAAGSTGTSGSGTTGTQSSGSSCAQIPDETAGPYPDKTGMISNSQFFRRDITEGKTGLPLTLTFTVVNVSSSCQPIAGANVEIWHCDKDGVYSEYGGQPGVADQSGTTFLRGVQTTDANGQVTFTTIYPGWYQGRVTHVHIQVFLNGSTTASKTTQMAFPDAVNTAVYGQNALYTKGQNSMTDSTDMVFSDGDTYELASMSGDTTSGYTATLTIGIAA